MRTPRKTLTLQTAPAPPTHPARRALGYREAFLAGVTAEDFLEVAKALLTKAKAGDVAAARLLFDRCLPDKSVQRWDTLRNVERVEGYDL